MKDYTSDSPQFSDSISIVETTDTNHADNINAAAKQLIANDLVLRDNADTHTGTTVTGESGIHGIRYYEDTLQCYDEESESWESVSSGSGALTIDTTGYSSTTTFADDGSIVETFEDGTTTTTSFADDGSIVETTVSADESTTQTLTVTFNDDSSITQTYSATTVEEVE